MQINGFRGDRTVKNPLVTALAVLLFVESAVMASATL
jgi:hypothetical protein